MIGRTGRIHPKVDAERWMHPKSLRGRVHCQITLRRNAERISHPVEKGEHRRNVNRLRDLGLAPSEIAQRLHVGGRGAIGCLGHLGDVFKQNAVCIVELRLCKVAGGQRLDCFFFGSLNTQEVGMRIQSIRATIKPGDPAGNRFLGLTRKMPFREVDRVAEAHHLT